MLKGPGEEVKEDKGIEVNVVKVKFGKGGEEST